MRQLIEQHLREVGTRRAVVLMTTFFLWASIALAVSVYAVLQGVWTFVLATWEARTGDPWRVVLAVILWVFFFLSWVLARASLGIFRKRRELRWQAEVGLTRIEKRLFPDEVATSYLESLDERLIVRALADLERRALGQAGSADIAAEERLVALDQALEAARRATAD